jgi:DNA modification methylase
VIHQGDCLEILKGIDSGSTGVAAIQNGFRFIGIEQDQAYLEMLKKRIFNAFPEFKKDIKL